MEERDVAGRFCPRQGGVRITAGVVMLALAAGLVLDLPRLLQRAVPDYTAGLQEQVSESEQVREALDLGGLENEQNKDLDLCTEGAAELERCGTAPDIRGVGQWLNSPPVDLKSLRGKVVLIDFWAYSCINCQRSLPHVIAWDAAYRDAGLRVIGVHAPEYAFEKEAGNVADAVARLGIRYPVALDNSLATWTNYRNRHWPAHYLVDASRTVRHIRFGEGDYGTTEKLIRELLAAEDPSVALPAPTGTADNTPDTADITPETCLGGTKQVNFAGTQPYRTGTFAPAGKRSPDSFDLSGGWTVSSQHVTPTGPTALVGLGYRAKEVRMVLSSTGTVRCTCGGEAVEVSGAPRSYRLVSTRDVRSGDLTAAVGSGVQAYRSPSVDALFAEGG